MVERPQIALADELRRRSGFPIACFGHAGDGNIHVNIMAAGYKEDAAVRGKVQIILDELFAKVLEWGGASTVWASPSSVGGRRQFLRRAIKCTRL